MNKYIQYILSIFILLSMASTSQGFYPLDKFYWRSSNYGEYRFSSYLHDGTDISAPLNTNVYSIKNGEIIDYYNPAQDVALDKNIHKGYGRYLLIKHDDNTYSRYCHLNRILKMSGRVTAGEKIAATGRTGTEYFHLHFEYWNASGQKIDPVTGLSVSDGLDQPNNGDAYIYKGVRYRRSKQLNETTNGVYVVTPGDDGKFDGIEDDVWYGISDSRSITVPYMKTGETFRIVVEAYDRIIEDDGRERVDMTTVPNKIYFKITDSSGIIVKDKNGHDSEGWVDFSKMTLTPIPSKAYLPMSADPIKNNFSITGPLKCESMYDKPGRIYSYWDWGPKEQKKYKLHIDVYDAYRNSGTLVSTITDSRDIDLSVGLYGFDFRDGVYAAAVPTELDILYSRADPSYFSPYSTTDNLPNKATIYARANKAADWTIKIFDQHSNVIRTINGSRGEQVRVAWDGATDSGGRAADGKYTYQVIANIGGESTYYDGDEIELETQSPILISLYISPLTLIISTSESTGVVFSSNEDLYSAKITLLDNLGNEVLFLGYIPGISANTSKTVVWDWAGQVANGNYKFRVTATDIAGNQTIRESSTIYINVPANTAPPLETLPQPDKPVENLPNLLPWEQRPKVSDMALDNSGNMYVLYGRYGKLVKYDVGGNIVKQIEGLRDPRGLAVSPAGDRVYMAETYSNQIMIYDGNLAYLGACKGMDVASYYKYVKTHKENWWGLNKWGYETTIFPVQYVFEGYDLPFDMNIEGDRLYVADYGKNRILKYKVSGNKLDPEPFDAKVADLVVNLSPADQQKLEELTKLQSKDAIMRIGGEMGKWLSGAQFAGALMNGASLGAALTNPVHLTPLSRPLLS
ncbi:peptidoglycan DD-metalloendopeptidase family protein [Candidatus Saganbacteria bacterium]|nr:peptidoglycan DD-metalloendopeptidase family protein [Candidatus Saganbacteria bacterium]